MRRLLLSCAAAGLLGSAMPAPAQAQDAPPAREEVATFASGCFWCTESDFEHLPGVLGVTSGYTGGEKADPTYHEVSAGGTGHAEAAEIRFDPAKVGYAELLDKFWHTSDFLDAGGQFCDRGDQYRSEIFTHGEEQKRLAEESKAKLQAARKEPVVTRIAEAGTFYPAEDYHQDYYKKNPIRYKFYRWNCGRDQRMAEIWGTPMPGS